MILHNNTHQEKLPIFNIYAKAEKRVRVGRYNLHPILMSSFNITIANARTGQPIKLFGEKLLREGGKLSDVYNQIVPSGNQITVEGIQLGARRIKLLRNGINKTLSQSDALVQSSIQCKTVNRELFTRDQVSQLMNPVNDVLYPGSIIIGSSVPTGSYTPITKPRNPIIVYVDGLNFSDPSKNSLSVDPPTGASVKSAIMSLVNQTLAGPQAAILTDNLEEVKSKEDIEIMLKTHFNGFGINISNAFNFDNSTSTYNLLMEFTQIYYNVSIVPPDSGTDFFEDAVEVQQDWTYISNISYGRRAVLAISIKDSEKIITNEFKLKINRILFGGDLSADVEVRKLVSSSNIKGFFFGGNPSGAAEVIGGSPEDALAKFQSLRRDGAIFSKDSPAVPLSYTLRFLNDHSIAMVEQTLNYPLRQCDDLLRYKITINDITCIQAFDQNKKNNAEEVFGLVKVNAFKTTNHTITFLNGETDLVFNLQRTSAVTLNTGQVHNINTSRIFDLNVKSNPDAYIKIWGDLTEKDTGHFDNDDKLEGAGTVYDLRHQLSQVKENYPIKSKLIFKSGDSGQFKSHLEINYTIEIVSRN